MFMPGSGEELLDNHYSGVFKVDALGADSLILCSLPGLGQMRQGVQCRQATETQRDELHRPAAVDMEDSKAYENILGIG